LWRFLARLEQSWRYGSQQLSKWNVLPVVNSELLWSRESLVRFRSDDFFQRDDPDFLMQFTKVLDEAWYEPLEAAAQQGRAGPLAEKQLAEFCSALGLVASQNASHIIEKAARQARQGSSAPRDLVRIAQIAAHLHVLVSKDFPYLTESGQVLTVAEGPVYRADGWQPEWLPEAHVRSSSIARTYGHLASCTARTWDTWVLQNYSGLLEFVRPTRKEATLLSRVEIANDWKARGLTQEASPASWPLGSTLSDFDYPEEVWEFWEFQARKDAQFWATLVKLIAPAVTSEHLKARVYHTTGRATKRNHDLGTFRSAWVARLRTLPCVADTLGQPQLPGALLRRTPQTVGYQDLVPFVEADLDHPDISELLDQLGVRTAPPGLEQILDLLRSLASVPSAPRLEVFRWYERLDRLSATAPTEQLQETFKAFSQEDLILTADNQWCRSGQVFVHPDEQGFSGALVLPTEVQKLGLWGRLGVQHKPSLDSYLPWLDSLEGGSKLSEKDRRQVDGLYRQFGATLLLKVRKVLNLRGEWFSVDLLRYGVLRGESLDTASLFSAVQAQTGDFRQLTDLKTVDLLNLQLRSLASALQYKLDNTSHAFSRAPTNLPWLRVVAGFFRRLPVPEGLEEAELVALAERLQRTKLVEVKALAMVPLLDGEPAGVPGQLPILWQTEELLVAERETGKWPRLFSRELARAFCSPEVGEALLYCYDRSETQIRRYLEDNFQLVNRPSTVVPATESSAEPTHVVGADDHSPLPRPTVVDPERAVAESVYLPATKPDPSSPPKETGSPASPAIPLEVLYALSIGLEPLHAKHFTSDLGSLVRSELGAFPWVFKDASGQVRQRLRFEAHCLTRSPLEVPAEVWNLVQNQPDQYTLVLKQPNEQPDVRSGRELVALKNQGQLKLHAATYRLALEDQ